MDGWGGLFVPNSLWFIDYCVQLVSLFDANSNELKKCKEFYTFTTDDTLPMGLITWAQNLSIFLQSNCMQILELMQ